MCLFLCLKHSSNLYVHQLKLIRYQWNKLFYFLFWKLNNNHLKMDMVRWYNAVPRTRLVRLRTKLLIGCCIPTQHLHFHKFFNIHVCRNDHKYFQLTATVLHTFKTCIWVGLAVSNILTHLNGAKRICGLRVVVHVRN